jgi:hypothetical protein
VESEGSQQQGNSTPLFVGRDRGADLVDKLKAIRGEDKPTDLIEAPYSLLFILDSKATGLLTLDRLIIALLCVQIALTSAEHFQRDSHDGHYAGLAAAVGSSSHFGVSVPADGPVDLTPLRSGNLQHRGQP